MFAVADYVNYYTTLDAACTPKNHFISYCSKLLITNKKGRSMIVLFISLMVDDRFIPSISPPEYSLDNPSTIRGAY